MERLAPMMTMNDRSALRARYAAEGIVQIASFLPDGQAETLQGQLRQRADWIRLFNEGGKLFELDRAAQATLDSGQRQDLDDAIYAGARSGFQYRYETIRVPDDQDARRASADPLARLALDLSGGDVSGLFSGGLAVAIYVLIVIILVGPILVGRIRTSQDAKEEVSA